MKYCFLALAFAIAILGSVTDIRYGKVKNKHLLIALVVWIISSLIYTIAWHGEFVFPFYYYGLNFVLSIGFSIVLYYLDIWAPGDIKLFLLLVLIYPFSCYVCKPGNIFPSLDIVIFAFASGYLFLLSSSILHKDTANAKDFILNDSKTLKRKLLNLFSNIGFFSTVNLLLQLYLPEFYKANHSLCILITAGLIYIFGKKTPKAKNTTGYCLFISFIILSIISKNTKQFFFNTIESILLAAIFGEMGRIIENNSYLEIDGKDVKPGMILSYTSVWAMQKCIDPNIPRTTTESRRSRITPEQAEAVKTWCQITKRTITIVDMLPFIPMLCFGLLTEILRYFLFIQ